VHLQHPLIVPETLEERAYQVNIARSAGKRSTLVVLPTGMGKTVIAVLVIAQVLHEKGGKILFMAPTKPLVEQHSAFLQDHLKAGPVAVFTGEVHPQDRELQWLESRLVVATPQVIKNDLAGGRISLKDVNLIVFDEAHRAVGDYAYVPVAEEYKEWGGLVLGITASPGSEVDKILEVCSNLGIEGIEIRTEDDPDVVAYVHETEIQTVRVNVPENMKRVLRLLRGARDDMVNQLRKGGHLKTGKPVSKRDLIAVGDRIQARLRSGERNFYLYRASSTAAAAVKIDHALEMAETQGIGALKEYISKLEAEGRTKKPRKATLRVLKNRKFVEASLLAKKLEFDQPKIEKVVEVVANQFRAKPDSRVIVFTHYRDTSERVTAALEALDGVRPGRFVGQAHRGDDKGLRQAEQVDMIRRFKAGDYNVLVATSVAEEGLDIPATDLVVLYEPVASEIRAIQRRGRTGRGKAGHVVGVLYRGTRDEAYHYSAHRKERKMQKELEKLRSELRQKIFVGDPTGGDLQGATRKASIEDVAARREDEPHRGPPAKWKQRTLLDEFE
jgi:Fanconi anemia group M protein